MKIIFGLGNPGNQYDKTPHNIGFCVVDKLCEKYGGKFGKTKMKGVFAEIFIENEKVLLVKPQTFMNLSGECVQKYLKKQKTQLKDALIILDDIDIPAGEIRFRQNGSGGTHNGLKNIVLLVGEEIPRLRVGVGKPENLDLTDFVLKKMIKSLQEKVELGEEKAIEKAVDFVLEKV